MGDDAREMGPIGREVLTPTPPTPTTERIDRCASEEQLEKLLAASFPYLALPELRAVPERIMGKLRRVPPRFLDRLVAKPHILDELPVHVKQQVRGCA